MPPTVEITAATLDDKIAIRHLVELYAHDFSELTGGDVDEHGEFGYPDLDRYWTDSDRHPFLIRVDGRIAGFALVRSGSPHDMAEFFVMRKYRRGGVGVQAARQGVRVVPGRLAGPSALGERGGERVLARRDPGAVPRGIQRRRSRSALSCGAPGRTLTESV